MTTGDNRKAPTAPIPAVPDPAINPPDGMANKVAPALLPPIAHILSDFIAIPVVAINPDPAEMIRLGL
jgi:hypothetical protein